MTTSEPIDLAAWAAQPASRQPCQYSWRAVFRQPLPQLAGRPLSRFLCRLIVASLGKRIVEISGFEHFANLRGPYILCLNHSSRTEALVIPALLMFQGGGRPLHFLADWNFMLYPGLGFLMRQGRVIPVGRKPARPRFLNRLKRFYVPPGDSLARAREVLSAGGTVGIFPEGTVNRNPRALLAGCHGAARLAQQTDVPILPVGVRHPGHNGQRALRGRDPMQLVIGPPLTACRDTSRAALEAHHARLMTALATLCGKPWQPLNQRKPHVIS